MHSKERKRERERTREREREVGERSERGRREVGERSERGRREVGERSETFCALRHKRPAMRPAGRPASLRSSENREPHTAVVLLKIPEVSIESLDESWIGRWVVPGGCEDAVVVLPPKSRPWNLKLQKS